MPDKKESEKTKELKNKLLMDKPRVWDRLTVEEKADVSHYTQLYIHFLNNGRTERKAVENLRNLASNDGFQDVTDADRTSNRIFQVLRGKLLFLAVLGQRPMTDGIRLVTSHVDSPRLDIKPSPLYEEAGLAMLKTHYYGGVKKFQWVARSLAMVGKMFTRDGNVVDVEIGLKPEDPILTIPDLLPHLSRKQMEQKASEFIPAENLNVVIGSLPYEDEETTDRVKLAILELLYNKYGITEEDFIGAEIEMVPAEPARDAGLDRSLVAGYGQDDRVCAFTSATALMKITEPIHTCVAVFYDKEEIGSEGNTSAKSVALDQFLMELMQKTGINPSVKNLRKVFTAGKALSGDVTAAVDPTYGDAYEKKNNSKIGFGIGITKYTGSGGKYMGSDANAEYASWVRRLFNDQKIMWQPAGLGKVDEGGGGTVAKYLANSGMDIIDCGPPILGMHSPLEVCAKDDIWMTHKAFKVFFES
ncbi:MAG: aminopeptidase [Desulfomonilaceae bacterium]